MCFRSGTLTPSNNTLVQSTLDPLNHLRAGDEPLFHFNVTFRAVHGRIIITAAVSHYQRSSGRSVTGLHQVPAT